MRIVGGTLSGRKLLPPQSRTTRPMMDRIRQALFNILEHHDCGAGIGNPLAGGEVLDAFCGTGALAFEALSRGAKYATLFDKDAEALAVARKNAAALGLEDRCEIRAGDALAPARAARPATLVFLAPPYRKDLIPPSLLALDHKQWIARHALAVAETAKKEALDVPDGFNLLFSRFYGDTGLHFLGRRSKTSV